MLFEQFHDMKHYRAVCQGDHRFWYTAGERLDSGAETAGHDDSFQDSFLLV
jgi:hypothetical protein